MAGTTAASAAGPAAGSTAGTVAGTVADTVAGPVGGAVAGPVGDPMAGPAAGRPWTGPMRLGSWPGREFDHNRFLAIFLDALAAEGVEVVDLPDTAAFRPAALDAAILHWAEAIFWESRSTADLVRRMARLLWRLARRPARVKVVWLVHNLAPHETFLVKRLLWRPYLFALSRLVDGALTLSPGTVPVVRAALPGLARRPVAAIWHPVYPGEALDAAGRRAARAARGWDEGVRVWGYCGQIRPYKGVEDLVAAFAGLADPGARLLLAGRAPDRDLAARLQTAAATDPRIRLELADLPAPAFRAALGACDVVVAPLRRYLHSGSILHALSAARPVLTPRTPFAESLQTALGPGWMRLYDGPLTPGVLAQAGAPAPAEPDLAPFAPFAPRAVATATLDILRGLGARGA